MSQENVEIVRSILASWGRGDFTVGPSHFDENLVFVSRPEFPAFGVYLGVEALAGFMRDFLSQWKWTTFETERLWAVGDTVIVSVIQRGEGRTSGAESRLQFFMLFTFRGDKVVRYETVMHEHEALKAVGLAE
jgi:ketosteroid isomerase-like protein